MTAGLENVRVMDEFHSDNLQSLTEIKINHHDQTTSVQLSFIKDVQSLVRVIDALGNPSEEDGPDLVNLVTKECIDPPAIQTVEKVREVGLEQFKAFFREFFVERIKPVTDTVNSNEFKVFKAQPVVNISKKKQKLACL